MNDKIGSTEAGRLQVRALLLGEQINLRDLEGHEPVAVRPLTVRVGAAGHAVLFRYGAVVLFGINPEEERQFLDMVTSRVAKPLALPETETAQIDIGPGAGDEITADGVIVLVEKSMPRLQIVAEALARSTVLGYYETRIAETFDLVQPLATKMRQNLPLGRHASDLLRHIGDALLTQQRMVGRVEVAENPEVLWEHSELELFYRRLADYYELAERARALDRKLDLVSRTASTILELVQARRSLRVEWYIVFLIVIEILITLYELFLRD